MGGAPALFFIGSAIVSTFPQYSMNWWPYALFAVGHALWAVAGALMRDRAVITMNLMFLPFDLIAISTRI